MSRIAKKCGRAGRGESRLSFFPFCDKIISENDGGRFACGCESTAAYGNKTKRAMEDKDFYKIFISCEAL
ncbi:MAG: hypothetical protein MRZ13_01490 [Clostridiales bacterium]|nr:hypothetical protein [Clostridiales bacterium]